MVNPGREIKILSPCISSMTPLMSICSALAVAALAGSNCIFFTIKAPTEGALLMDVSGIGPSTAAKE